MKFWEAVLIGSMMRPKQARHAMFDGAGTCALGAAAFAVNAPMRIATTNNEDGVRGKIGIGNIVVDLALVFPELARRAACPACAATGDIGGVVGHLNDYHGWTREAIADWVATVEPDETAQEVAQAQETQAETTETVPA